MKKSITSLAILAATLLSSAAYAEDVTLIIESWRNDDLTLWQDKIIPAFEAENPGIKLKFTPMAPTEYNSAINSKLEAGSAGDIITCRPFDASLALYQAGLLTDLSDMDAMDNFTDVAKAGMADRRWLGHLLRADGLGDPWLSSTTRKPSRKWASRSRQPKTNSSQSSTSSRKMAPISRWRWATNDQWEAATMGYQNIGPDLLEG